MNWYKKYKKGLVMSSVLKDVSFKGKLKKRDNGFVYIDVKDDIVDPFFAMLDEEGAVKPPYFGKDNVGAHISVISEDEMTEDLKIKELGNEFTFTLRDVKSTIPEGWDEMERVWFIRLDAPELNELRKKYNLPATYKAKGHKFHITFAVKKRK